MSPDAASFARLAREMQAHADEPITAATIVELAASTLPGVDGASVTIRLRRGRFRSLGVSSSIMEKADAAQHELREGPCVDAIAQGDWFQSGRQPA